MGEDQLMGITSVLGASALLPAGLGFRNKIINGSFDIWQRGTSFNAAGYTADRWAIVGASGQTVSVTQQAFTPGNAISGQEPTFYARIAWSGTPSGTFWFTQRVEDVRTCAGQQVMLSFWAKASSETSVFAPTIEQNFGTGGSSVVTTTASTITLTTSWQKFVVSFNIPSISGKTIGTNSYLDVRPLNGGSTVNGINIDIWGVQLEQNYQATPFEYRPISIELHLCKRYFWRCIDPAGVGVNDSSIRSTRTLIPFHTEMRSAPTTTVSGTFNFWNGTTTGTGTGLIGTYNSKNHGQLDFNGGAGSSTGCVTLYTNGGSQYLDFNSEL
jgi:hypothetical protein